MTITPENISTKPRLTVIGTGYLGATHAAAMAELGFEVLGVDVDPDKIERLSRGVLPFHEPDLPELLTKHLSSGRLKFTTSVEEAGAFGDIHFIAVGTPQKDGEGGADMTYVDEAVRAIATAATHDCVIVGKSTVPVGSARRLQNLVESVKRPNVDISFAWNPEFLREGFAVQDTLRPDRLVVGANDETAITALREVYEEAISRDTPFITTDYETAELVKVAANAFLATKISFINAFAEVTEKVGGDIRTLADAIGHDARIGRKFLNAGVGFGGGCLPKDIRALQARVSELGLDRTMAFLHEVDNINLRRRERVIDVAHSLTNGVNKKKIAVLGTTFKPNSDDVRDSPALDIAARLYGQGADVRVFDPKGMENSAKRFPRLTYSDSLEAALQGADLVLLLTEWQEFREMDPVQTAHLVDSKKIVDGRNVLDRMSWINAGWDYHALGMKSAHVKD
ncbi:UDP-glucose/GDP-mannose dehydrogenase family protein [Glutamicibacter sp. BW77]|uniref:UDP-glucose dehydrogenase family protein n=1 Tax=Glutamicibacter sp. BW77 TaxID=2024402 RepID=UPI000BB6B055|nr:UDP-glucose/GDP-mannose dehydrogenase family protein [Glutamicibacter sp. BW77]PCC35780.1 UDP-glucose 6-dehydrogenase [Glutamicibacter sp. BW77]